jgi:hypothetical protein
MQTISAHLLPRLHASHLNPEWKPFLFIQIIHLAAFPIQIHFCHRWYSALQITEMLRRRCSPVTTAATASLVAALLLCYFVAERRAGAYQTPYSACTEMSRVNAPVRSEHALPCLASLLQMLDNGQYHSKKSGLGARGPYCTVQSHGALHLESKYPAGRYCSDGRQAQQQHACRHG